MHHSRQDAFDAAARARAGHAAEWHPVLAAIEQRPGCWHMTTPYGEAYAVLQIVRVGGEIGYRAVTFAPTSEQRRAREARMATSVARGVCVAHALAPARATA